MIRVDTKHGAQRHNPKEQENEYHISRNRKGDPLHLPLICDVNAVGLDGHRWAWDRFEEWQEGELEGPPSVGHMPMQGYTLEEFDAAFPHLNPAI